MTKTTKTPIVPTKPGGTLTTQIDNQTFVIEVFFNHYSKEIFQDKLLRVIITENLTMSGERCPFC